MAARVFQTADTAIVQCDLTTVIVCRHVNDGTRVLTRQENKSTIIIVPLLMIPT